MAVAMVSALTGIAVRFDTAMTGEITLRGRVLRIGGLKEKVLAAHRGRITRVLIPEENSRDVEEIPDLVREAIEIVPVAHMDRVLKEALVLGGAGLASYREDDASRPVASPEPTERGPEPAEDLDASGRPG
jgi:ATP-dependent Lon protease